MEIGIFGTNNTGCVEAIRTGRLQTNEECQSWQFLGYRMMPIAQARRIARELVQRESFKAVRIFQFRNKRDSGKLIHTVS